MKLGKREIDALACPAHRRDLLVFDDDLTGFGLRVTAKGAKIFLFQYRRGSALRRMKIGRYGDITPAQARRIAEQARGEVAAGRDPAAERAAALAAEKMPAAGERLDAVIVAWTQLALASRSPAHRRDAPATLRRSLKEHLTSPASELTTSAIQRIVDGIAKKHPVSARRLRDYGRAMLNWAMERGKVAANPFVAVVIEAPVRDRDRVLTDEELGAAWRATLALPYPFGPLFGLLILTLQRRNEVAGLRWSELAPDHTLWTIPSRRAKNRKGHLVHLTRPARAILAQLPRIKGQDLLFSTTGKRQVSGFTHAVQAMRAQIAREAGAARPEKDTEAWRLHDFRRTGVTAMARLGIPMQVADRMLNHVESKSSRSVADIYQRHEYLAERQAAAERWAEHVLAAAASIAQPVSTARKRPRHKRRASNR